MTYIYFDDVLEKTEDEEFTIGQSYEEKPAQKLQCKKCKSDKFIVGQGSYYTAIKCPVCLYEICIHEG
jgi:hypothetical protein